MQELWEGDGGGAVILESERDEPQIILDEGERLSVLRLQIASLICMLMFLYIFCS